MLRPSRELSSRLTAVLLLAGVAWSLVAFGLEARSLHHRWRHQAWSSGHPSRWRPGTPPPQRLGAFLALADGFVDPPGAIAFTSRLSGHEGLVAWLWAGYLLPHRDLVPAWMVGEEVEVGWLVAWRQTIEHRRLEEVLRTDDGALYRVAP